MNKVKNALIYLWKAYVPFISKGIIAIYFNCAVYC